MSCSVNLVPTQRLTQRRRARRCTSWTVACLAAGLAVAAGWAVQQMGAGAVAHLRQRVQSTEQERARLQRELTLADVQRGALLTRLEAVTAARRPQPWPQRLVSLTREAPPAVFLTDLTMGQPGQAGAPNRAQTGALGTSRARERRGGQLPEGLQRVEMLGFALDHGALLQFVNTLQGLPGWEQVELVKASLGPYRSGEAIAFELDCRTREDLR